MTTEPDPVDIVIRHVHEAQRLIARYIDPHTPHGPDELRKLLDQLMGVLDHREFVRALDQVESLRSRRDQTADPEAPVIKSGVEDVG